MQPRWSWFQEAQRNNRQDHLSPSTPLCRRRRKEYEWAQSTGRWKEQGVNERPPSLLWMLLPVLSFRGHFFGQSPPLRPWGDKEKLYIIFRLGFLCPELPWNINCLSSSVQLTWWLYTGPKLLASRSEYLRWWEEHQYGLAQRYHPEKNQGSSNVFSAQLNSYHVLGVVRDLE